MSANTGPAPGVADATQFAAEDRYRVLVELAPFYLLEIGLDGTLLWANQAGLQLVGVSDVHAIAGVTFASVVGHSSQAQVDRWLLEAANGASCHFDFSSDGANQRHYKACLLPIKDAQDKVMRLMSVVDDITERKQMEIALTASEELFRTVADYTLDWEYWVGPQSRLLYMSPSCEGITGYTREEFFADPSLLTRITFPQDMALLECHQREVNSNENGALEYRIVHRDGSVRWLEP